MRLKKAELLLKQSTIADLLDTDYGSLSKKISSMNLLPTVKTPKIKKYSFDTCRDIIKKSKKFTYNQPHKQVHTFFNFKGGTGKTSICYQVSWFLAALNFDVLMIDLDPQSHLTSCFLDEQEQKYTMHDVLIHNLPIEQAIIPVAEGLSIIPSNLELTRTEFPLSQRFRKEEVIKKSIASLKNKFDFIFIDANPAMSTLNINALNASDQVQVVCETQPFSLAGLNMLITEITAAHSLLEKELSFNVIANKYEQKTAISQEVVGVLRMDYGTETLRTIVRKSEEFNISNKTGIPVLFNRQLRSTAFEDIRELTIDILEKAKVKNKVNAEAVNV